ncbi:hypothetical protein AVEN_94417-1 [Araneus ventricosus]|uniref:Helitron helicase-like domain-containing protein n=1 Tax=Araneus ventricosus TaxID=182803 RepID=A0A4Y2J218_ARAVE|nr:hypothetical protein AVEN_94417-1 [Araneus ventricosus]
MDDPTVHSALGKSIAQVYTIEFQKRGLPHAQILIVLRADDKFSTSEHIDKFVRAEIPSSIENLRLHEIVTKCLMHGPCGIENPGAPCMEAGQCKKMFPKEFRTETTMNVSTLCIADAQVTQHLSEEEKWITDSLSLTILTCC